MLHESTTSTTPRPLDRLIAELPAEARDHFERMVKLQRRSKTAAIYYYAGLPESVRQCIAAMYAEYRRQGGAK